MVKHYHEGVYGKNGVTMNYLKKVLLRIPGWLATAIMIFLIAGSTYWGMNEMYHEGWWGDWTNRLPYLVPILATLLPALLAFRWPLIGGGLLIVVGVFAFFFFSSDVQYIGIAIALVGGAFVFDGIVSKRITADRGSMIKPWWRRDWRSLLAFGVSLLISLGISIRMLPVVLTRVDDGDRGVQLIEGNGVRLIWAPAGPGWNWQQPWGGYPSWQSLALYGLEPVGFAEKAGYGRLDNGEVVFAGGEDMARGNLCLYLSEDGTTLMSEPQNIWRMPTTDELVRSLGRHGENAGCTWQGELGIQVKCNRLPDKESPLWATDQAVIYYWSADSHSQERGYFVAYNGTVNASYKLGGNPRHGYRCVREP